MPFRARSAGLKRTEAQDDVEMVVNRLIAGLAVLVFNLWLTSHFHIHGRPFLAPGLYLLGDILVWGHVLCWPARIQGRRIAALFIDCGAISYEMHIGGPVAGWLIAGFLWVVLGNGFRFGARQQAYAMLVSALGFCAMVAFTPYWRAQVSLCFGVLLGIAFVPLYAMMLINRLSQARAQAEAASRAKTQFLASVSHELRTPLNAVIGMGALLENTPLNPEQSMMSRSIMVSARSLLTLIEGVLDLAQIEAGRIAISTSDFDVVQMLSDINAIFYAQAAAKKLSIGFHVTPRTPVWLHGDVRRLREVIINLVGNAIKFTEAGGVTLGIDAEPVVDGSVRLRVEVSDTGIGIAGDAHKRIFESFTQADDSILNRFGGTGLGLSIVHKTVLALGGEIGVDSEPGNGARFWLQIPLRPLHRLVERDKNLPPMRAFVLDNLDGAAASLIGRLAKCSVRVEYVIVNGAAAQPGDSAPVSRLAFVGTAPDGQTSSFEELQARNALSFVQIQDEPAPGLPGVEMQRQSVGVLYPTIPDAELANLLYIVSYLPAHAGMVERGGQKQVIAAKKFNLLVADDNATNRSVMEMILRKAGHNVTLVEDGEEALDAMESADFDAALFDVNMPNLDGIEVTKIYRMTTSERTPMPIIAVTADAMKETRDRCLAAGMAACVVKPFDPADLIELIDQVVGAVKKPAEQDPRVTEIAAHPRYRANTGQAIDRGVITRLRALGGDAFVEEVIDTFRSEARSKILGLRTALNRKDVQGFRSHCHALRSVAINVGAARLAQACIPFEHCGAEDLAKNAEGWLEQITSELERVNTALVSLSQAPAAGSGE